MTAENNSVVSVNVHVWIRLMIVGISDVFNKYNLGPKTSALIGWDDLKKSSPIRISLRQIT